MRGGGIARQLLVETSCFIRQDILITWAIKEFARKRLQGLLGREERLTRLTEHHWRGGGQVRPESSAKRQLRIWRLRAEQGLVRVVASMSCSVLANNGDAISLPAHPLLATSTRRAGVVIFVPACSNVLLPSSPRSHTRGVRSEGPRRPTLPPCSSRIAGRAPSGGARASVPLPMLSYPPRMNRRAGVKVSISPGVRTGFPLSCRASGPR